MQRSFLVGVVGLFVLFCFTPVRSGDLVDNIVQLTRPFHQPTTPIYELLDQIDRQDHLAIRHVAVRLRQPAALHLLRQAWQQAHQPPIIVLGPYRSPAFPLPGAELVIPLRLTCHHGNAQFAVTVTFTVQGWQVSDIRLPYSNP
ncbi:hypothetical protein [Chloroflexus sp. MS-G]|jgi:hypothetical protein|uniref:hypothetical protein n=1 Tax=Chloroflexus sp. MS-G TaxID=1521187 RepID=UPI0004DEFA64|nr:hypothetical protein [Chloroflexus sp. MS-G]MBO9349840.1 hypothetical protein [Chloroflexus sp.]